MAGQLVHLEIPADDTAKGRASWGSLLGGSSRGIPGPFEDHATQISDQTGRAITNMEPAKRGMRAHFDVATLIMALILGAWRRDAQRNGQPSSATVTSP